MKLTIHAPTNDNTANAMMIPGTRQFVVTLEGTQDEIINMLVTNPIYKQISALQLFGPKSQNPTKIKCTIPVTLQIRDVMGDPVHQDTIERQLITKYINPEYIDHSETMPVNRHIQTLEIKGFNDLSSIIPIVPGAAGNMENQRLFIKAIADLASHSNLSILRLNNLNISSETANVLAETIYNSCLKTLDLSDNCINNQGAIAILEAIEECPTLENVSLSSNQITLGNFAGANPPITINTIIKMIDNLPITHQLLSLNILQTQGAMPTGNIEDQRQIDAALLSFARKKEAHERAEAAKARTLMLEKLTTIHEEMEVLKNAMGALMKNIAPNAPSLIFREANNIDKNKTELNNNNNNNGSDCLPSNSRV